MTGSVDPEREIVRRAAPWGLPSAVLALAIGVVVSGWPAGWSAAIGVLVVTANAVAAALSMAWAARRSPQHLYAVGLGGVVVRLGAIVGLMALLGLLPWFSHLAFGLAVFPATLLLLAFEMRLLGTGLGSVLTIAPKETSTR